MKVIFLFCFAFLGLLGTTAGLTCWECEDSFGNDLCLKNGFIAECESNQEFCATELRHGGWGETPWVRKACKTEIACIDNYVQNARAAWASKGSQIQCNENVPSSVCRCCCSGDLCNQNQTTCLFNSRCPSIQAPDKGFMECTNGFGLLSTCEFSCKRGFALIGEKSITCDAFGNWSNPVPRCQRITCIPIETSPHGTQRCSMGSKLHSRCRFACNEGYRLDGQSVLQCIEDKDDDEYGVWGSLPPRCIPKQCPMLDALPNGMIICSDSNFVGSSCEYRCDASRGYDLYPQNFSATVTCQGDETWDEPRQPCCERPCPPYTFMDFVVLLDSSSSIGAANWQRIKDFVESFIDEFRISDDTVHVAVIRYSATVDETDQILFNSFPNNKQGLLDAIQNLTYLNGEGTNTGAALNYVRTNVLPLGNRPEARNVVLLVTDGEAQDRVTISSFELREDALVYAVPIQARSGAIRLNQIRDIVGFEESHILKSALTGGFEALDDEFARAISEALCEEPCPNF